MLIWGHGLTLVEIYPDDRVLDSTGKKKEKDGETWTSQFFSGEDYLTQICGFT